MLFCGNNDNNGCFQYNIGFSGTEDFWTWYFFEVGTMWSCEFPPFSGDLLVEPTFSNSSSLPGRKSGTSMARSAGDVLIVLGGGSQGWNFPSIPTIWDNVFGTFSKHRTWKSKQVCKQLTGTNDDIPSLKLTLAPWKKAGNGPKGKIHLNQPTIL